jgi:general secretion pathway protein G
MKMMVGNGFVQTRKSALQRGFTLIEILVVVAIIVILVGAVIAIGSNIRSSSMRQATQGELQALEAAAEAYRLERGDLPASFGDGTYFGILMSDPASRKAVQKINPVLFDDAKNPTRVNDSWGNRIQYQPAGPNGSPPLRGYFFSCGPNGSANDADDIRSGDAAK